MFGTFQAEEERPTYGITKPLNSWNAVWANMSHYADMAQDLKRIPRWDDRIRYLFKRPGWLPDYLGGYRTAPDVNPDNYRKYDTPSPLSLNLYVLFQYLLCLLGTALFLFNAAEFSLSAKAFITLLITITVVNCGVLFEQRRWVKWAEWLRIFTYPVLLSAMTVLFDWPMWLHGLSLLYFLISFTWFYTLQRQHAHLQMA
jgi:hypothetical protein